MNWQRLRRPQITLRVMFALTTLVAIVVWYQTRQRFEVIGDLSADDFAEIRGLVRSQSQFKGESLIRLHVYQPSYIQAISTKWISPYVTYRTVAQLRRVGSKWMVQAAYKDFAGHSHPVSPRDI